MVLNINAAGTQVSVQRDNQAVMVTNARFTALALGSRVKIAAPDIAFDECIALADLRVDGATPDTPEQAIEMLSALPNFKQPEGAGSTTPGGDGNNDLQTNIDNHVNDTNNPHQVRYSQLTDKPSLEMPFTAYYDTAQQVGYQRWVRLCTMKSTREPAGWESNVFKFNLSLAAGNLVDDDGNAFNIETMINNIVCLQRGWDSIGYQGGNQGHWKDTFIIYSDHPEISKINLYFGSYLDANDNKWAIEIWACNHKEQDVDANKYAIKINSVEMISRVDSYSDISYEYYSTNPLVLTATPAGTGRFAVEGGTEMWTEITKQ